MTRDQSHTFVVAHVPDGWECSKCKCGWHDRRAVLPCSNETAKAPAIDWFSANASAG